MEDDTNGLLRHLMRRVAAMTPVSLGLLPPDGPFWATAAGLLVTAAGTPVSAEEQQMLQLLSDLTQAHQELGERSLEPLAAFAPRASALLMPRWRYDCEGLAIIGQGPPPVLVARFQNGMVSDADAHLIALAPVLREHLSHLLMLHAQRARCGAAQRMLQELMQSEQLRGPVAWAALRSGPWRYMPERCAIFTAYPPRRELVAAFDKAWPVAEEHGHLMAAAPGFQQALKGLLKAGPGPAAPWPPRNNAWHAAQQTLQAYEDKLPRSPRALRPAR